MAAVLLHPGDELRRGKERFDIFGHNKSDNIINETDICLLPEFGDSVMLFHRQIAFMTYSLPPIERDHLRRLARCQAEIAALPVMQQRRQLWTDINDAKPGARPPVVIETWTFDRDFMPASVYQCKSEYGRHLENKFLRAIRHHEILNDDHVCPDTLDMNWHVWQNEFGIEIKKESVQDQDGVDTGYHFDCPIQDLSEGFDLIKPATFDVNR